MLRFQALACRQCAAGSTPCLTASPSGSLSRTRRGCICTSMCTVSFVFCQDCVKRRFEFPRCCIMQRPDELVGSPAIRRKHVDLYQLLFCTRQSRFGRFRDDCWSFGRWCGHRCHDHVSILVLERLEHCQGIGVLRSPCSIGLQLMDNHPAGGSRGCGYGGRCHSFCCRA